LLLDFFLDEKSYNNWLFFIDLLIQDKILIIYNLNLDRIKTDFRRFKPNSRIILLDEQSNLL